MGFNEIKRVKDSEGLLPPCKHNGSTQPRFLLLLLSCSNIPRVTKEGRSKETQRGINIFLLFGVFLAAPCVLWDLSSLTRD